MSQLQEWIRLGVARRALVGYRLGIPSLDELSARVDGPRGGGW